MAGIWTEDPEVSGGTTRSTYYTYYRDNSNKFFDVQSQI